MSAKRDTAIQQRDAALARLDVLENYVPTPEAENALPAGLGKYIHDLATRTDPSGDVQTIACLREQVKELTAKIAVLSTSKQENRDGDA